MAAKLLAARDLKATSILAYKKCKIVSHFATKLLKK
jgi:hypothetical protein